MTSDTSPTVDRLLGALYRQRTPGERVRMATGGFALGKALASAGLLQRDAASSPLDTRIALARRLHGDDLPPGWEAAIRRAKLKSN